MGMRLVSLFVVVAVLSVASLAVAQKNPCNPCAKEGTVFNVNDPKNRNAVTMTSEAPLEDIVGTSNKITGYIIFDPSDPDKGGEAKLSVPVASINTGIPLRDEHLQGAAWLDAGAHPDITLEVTRVKSIEKVKTDETSATFNMKVAGYLSIKGIRKPIEFEARVTYLRETERTKSKMPGDLLAARATFDVTLADYDITGPRGAGLIGSKVGETVQVAVSVMGTNASMEMAGNPCNPCGGKAKNPCNPCGM